MRHQRRISFIETLHESWYLGRHVIDYQNVATGGKNLVLR